MSNFLSHQNIWSNSVFYFNPFTISDRWTKANNIIKLKYKELRSQRKEKKDKEVLYLPQLMIIMPKLKCVKDEQNMLKEIELKLNEFVSKIPLVFKVNLIDNKCR